MKKEKEARIDPIGGGFGIGISDSQWTLHRRITTKSGGESWSGTLGYFTKIEHLLERFTREVGVEAFRDGSGLLDAIGASVSALKRAVAELEGKFNNQPKGGGE